MILTKDFTPTLIECYRYDSVNWVEVDIALIAGDYTLKLAYIWLEIEGIIVFELYPWMV